MSKRKLVSNSCPQIYYYSGGVHHTEALFPDHATFRPERFLSATGRFVLDERVIYFGTGKRRCAGEILAR